MMDCSATLPGDEGQEIIVFASRQVLAPDDVGVRMADSPLPMREPSQPVEAVADAEEPPQHHGQVPSYDADQIQVEAALRDEPAEGVALSTSNTLSSLRQAAQNLGLGKSGGKHTVLKRIRDHKQQLVATHKAMMDATAADTREALELPKVHMPSDAEVQQHSLTRMPYKPWCVHCAAFRARADKHAQVHDVKRTHSILCFDFCYTHRHAGETKLCCLVAHDEHTKWIQAWPVPSKGGINTRQYMAAELTRLLSYLGHREVTLRADLEPSCTAPAEAVKVLRGRIGMQPLANIKPMLQKVQLSASDSMLAQSLMTLNIVWARVSIQRIPSIIGAGAIQAGCSNDLVQPII